MNNKGFTLIELLASIAIIAMISLIITPIVTGTIKNNKIEACKKMFSSVEAAAQNYVSDNRYDNGIQTGLVSADGLTINSNTLISASYLSGSLKNPLDNQVISFNVNVKYNKTNRKYTYTTKTSADESVDDVCK